ncbi:hypothetical protein BV898_08080 [Hypsibius exemplaris]|uniref:Mediator of RNA polymerase II transcription subunit 22 n=1 Tax=Hypsibius exemplaris TaxID=2072580 RepID=A0A1W0WRH9_HYPEX|nr:hypothetical protein BV898_08080 [Hypsibius exemplaris]
MRRDTPARPINRPASSMAQRTAGGTVMNRSENTLKDLSKKQKEYVGKMLENFLEILKLMKLEEDRGTPIRVQTAEQEQLEMAVRAANVVRSAENLLALSEDLKKLFFLNDFPYITQTVQKARDTAKAESIETQARMIYIYREMENELLDLEEEYGSVWYLKPQDPILSDLTNGDAPH